MTAALLMLLMLLLIAFIEKAGGRCWIQHSVLFEEIHFQCVVASRSSCLGCVLCAMLRFDRFLVLWFYVKSVHTLSFFVRVEGRKDGRKEKLICVSEVVESPNPFFLFETFERLWSVGIICLPYLLVSRLLACLIGGSVRYVYFIMRLAASGRQIVHTLTYLVDELMVL